MKKTYNKLIRDNIPEIIEQDNHDAVIKKLSAKDFKKELSKKLVEEAIEVSESENREELIKELSDLQEVLLSFYEEFNISCPEVNKVRRKRLKKRGGFKKKLFLVSMKPKK